MTRTRRTTRIFGALGALLPVLPLYAIAIASAATSSTAASSSLPGDHGDARDVLGRARRLEPPPAESVLYGDTEGAEWWAEHDDLLRAAWDRWEREQQSVRAAGGEGSFPEARRLVDPALVVGVDRATKDPTAANEAAAVAGWEAIETGDGNDRVFVYPSFLDAGGVRLLRERLDALPGSGIPTRRPNAMNRNGLLLDTGIPGGASGDGELHAFLAELAGSFARPLGRALFPSFCGNRADDASYYAFTIRYGTGYGTDRERAADRPCDTELKEHSDASLYTLNVNLNLPDEEYSGSSLYFVAPETHSATPNATSTVSARKQRTVAVPMEPGTAVLHRGASRHGALPLEGGSRYNLVVWLYGGGDAGDHDEGYVRVAPYREGERLPVRERWSLEPPRGQAQAQTPAPWRPGQKEN